MPDNPENEIMRYTVPPVERAIRLLRYIGDGNTCRPLSSAAKDLNINRTTLIRIIHTLRDARMIAEIAEGAGYRLGPGLISLGAQALHGRDIVQLCQPVLAALCRETGMSAHLGILDGIDVVYLSRETPNTHLVSNVHAGSRLPAHASSMGRAILAAMSRYEIRALFDDQPFAATTDKTPLSIEAVLAQAAADRAANVVWSEGNFEPGIGSCAAVILDHTGAPVGGINVSGPRSAFAGETGTGGNAIRDAVARAGRAASQAMGHSG